MNPALRWILVALYILLPDPIPGPVDDAILLFVMAAKDGPDLLNHIRRKP